MSKSPKQICHALGPASTRKRLLQGGVARWSKRRDDRDHLFKCQPQATFWDLEAIDATGVDGHLTDLSIEPRAKDLRGACAPR